MFSAAFVSSLRVLKRSVSFGSVTSTVELPAFFSHAAIALYADPRTHTPPDKALIRISIGCEHVDDLLMDIDHALAHAATATETAPEPVAQTRTDAAC